MSGDIFDLSGATGIMCMGASDDIKCPAVHRTVPQNKESPVLQMSIAPKLRNFCKSTIFCISHIKNNMLKVSKK